LRSPGVAFRHATLMRRYRIVHVISSLDVGGAEVLLLSLVTQLRHAGFDNEVIALGAGDTLKSEFLRMGIPVHQIGMARNSFPGVGQAVKLMRLGRSLRPDLIQGWMAHGNLAGVLLRIALFRSVPLLWSVHQTLGEYDTQPLNTRFSLRALALLSWIPRRIIYVSRTSRAEHRAMGFRDTNAIHIPNGVDTRVFRGGADRRAMARAALGLPDAARVIGHVARYHPKKDQQTLLSALASLLPGVDDAFAVLVGQGLTRDNPELQSWSRDARFSGRLLLLGPRPDIAELLPAFDVFCLSSAYGEACPVVILEAMSSGLRCVVTDVADAAWMLGGTGAVVPPGDPLALAAALERMLNLSAEDATILSRQARARVLEIFSQERMIESYCRIYRAAIEASAIPST